jgi:hypothetical protein
LDQIEAAGGPPGKRAAILIYAAVRQTIGYRPHIRK